MFIVNLPPKKVWVRKEYLRDLRDGHGEYVLGYWVSLKSIWGRSFYFETYMPEYGAMFDNLHISAFGSKLHSFAALFNSVSLFLSFKNSYAIAFKL